MSLKLKNIIENICCSLSLYGVTFNILIKYVYINKNQKYNIKKIIMNFKLSPRGAGGGGLFYPTKTNRLCL